MSPALNFVASHFFILTNQVIQGATNYLIGNLKEHDYIQLIQKFKVIHISNFHHTSIYFLIYFFSHPIFIMCYVTQPTSAFLFAYLAVQLSRHPDLEKMDFSFLKSFNIGGWTIDATTVELLMKRLPHVSLAQVYY
jgi:hypothetical protein